MNGQSPMHVAIAVACLACTQACDSSPAAERELVHADAEVFEAVARSQRAFGAEDSLRAPRFLRIDSRPIDNAILLASQARSPQGSVSMTIRRTGARALECIVRERSAILERLGVEEGRTGGSTRGFSRDRRGTPI